MPLTNEIQHCAKCHKEIGIGNSFYCDKCGTVCSGCCKHYQPRTRKPQSKKQATA